MRGVAYSELAAGNSFFFFVPGLAEPRSIHACKRRDQIQALSPACFGFVCLEDGHRPDILSFFSAASSSRVPACLCVFAREISSMLADLILRLCGGHGFPDGIGAHLSAYL